MNHIKNNTSYLKIEIRLFKNGSLLLFQKTYFINLFISHRREKDVSVSTFIIYNSNLDKNLN